MGSVNCKEYVTTSEEREASDRNRPCSGTSGSYNPKPTETKMSDEYTDAVEVCNVSDLNENEMKQFDFHDQKVLVIKQNGNLSAIGNKCTHYGAPLSTGCLGKGRVRCPWHGACFNIKTGDIEDFPGLDSVPVYQVDVAGDGKVLVRAKRKDLASTKRLKDMVARDPTNEQTFVVVGGGPAGGVCVETLRQEGFTGRIVMICRESVLPYDRVKISKSLDINIATVQYRDPEFYAEHDIETLLGVEATELNTEAKTVSCSNGYSIKYDKIFIATGSRALKPPIPGADLKNVVTVRDHADGNAIYEMMKPEYNVVCLGSSFIALESAAYFNKKVNSVTVIGRDSVPLKMNFGEQIGERVLQLFKDNGVNMVMNSGITEITGNDYGQVVSVTLIDGTVLPCDLLLMGTGGRAYTDFLQGSGVKVNPNASIDTDEHLRSNIPEVFVGGDIANAPVYSIGNERATIGHYQLAQYHGRIAAKNMAGNMKKLHAVPFFFTLIFGKGFRYSGYGKFSDVIIDGSLEEMKFAAYFINDASTVVAVASCGRDPIVAQFAELQSQGKRLARCDIVDQEPNAWLSMLKSC